MGNPALPALPTYLRIEKTTWMGVEEWRWEVRGGWKEGTKEGKGGKAGQDRANARGEEAEGYDRAAWERGGEGDDGERSAELREGCGRRL